MKTVHKRIKILSLAMMFSISGFSQIIQPFLDNYITPEAITVNAGESVDLT
jgi:hypothetical protein